MTNHTGTTRRIEVEPIASDGGFFYIQHAPGMVLETNVEPASHLSGGDFEEEYDDDLLAMVAEAEEDLLEGRMVDGDDLRSDVS